MNPVWLRIDALLNKRLNVLRVLHYRHPGRVGRYQQKEVAIKACSEEYWYDLMIAYGGCSDQELHRILDAIEGEMDFELSKACYEY